MTSRSFPGAPAETITWTYDSIAAGNKGKGRLTGVTDPSGSAAYTYNVLGQRTKVVRVTGGRTYQTSYAFDKAGNVTQITLPSGRIVTYTRDTLARVTAVSTKDNSGAATKTVVSSATWRPFGPLASMTFGNSLALTLTYDNDGRVTNINTTGAGTTVQNLVYGYDLASNITSIGDNLTASRSQTFVYDNLNRLTSATGLYGTNTYAYDAVGNRTQRTVTVPSAATETYTVAANSNRLTSIAGAVNRSFTYAASGQTATDQRSPVSAWSYTTDKAGRMSAAVLNSVTQATFAYDGDELRIANTNSLTSTTTHYVYDANGQLIAEANGATGAVIREYLWLGALPIGYVDRLGSAGASRLFFVHADHLGRPQKITDATRATVWDGVFAPFGEIHAVTGSIVNVLMFPGQVYDPETGLSQNWHRDYDANIGRYLQSDPIGLEGGINTFAYVGGNPVADIDPTGLEAIDRLRSSGWGLPPDKAAEERRCAAQAFWRNFNDMTSANWKKSDRYFHCKANCEASRCGPSGPSCAKEFGDWREWFDQNIKGNSAADSASDQAVNRSGRLNAAANPGLSCPDVCRRYRPGGLPPQY